MRVTTQKNCYCHTCGKAFHYLGINRHTAMHRDRREDCRVTYTHGDTYWLRFSRIEQKMHPTEGGLRASDGLSAPATIGG